MAANEPSKVIVSGVAASPGRVRGTARVILPGHEEPLLPGEILVTRITDASMYPDIIEHAIAIVADLGGVASHPAIVARELGIPCVVATEHGTALIVTGQAILVDGTSGIVYESD